MTGNEIRRRFTNFFASKNHTIVPSAPLVPENDPTVLFNTAGMQPLVPYLMGQPHPTGAKRIANSQKCLRTNDIDEVGDNTHLTFFEMLGNWSLGDYFKAEAIEWSFEFITAKDVGLGLDARRLYVTVFAGDENAPKDEEAYNIWHSIFTKAGMDPDKRIFFMPAEANWWSPGDNGPCGPDSEMFYDVTGKHTEGLSFQGFNQADDKQEIVEIWNDVFMEYEKKDGKVIGKLKSQNVDTGSGLERVTAMVQGVHNVFETDLFLPITTKINTLSVNHDERARRIIADHIRASTFLLSDGVVVSNTDQGYILRRLLRRSIRQADKLGMPDESLSTVAEVIIAEYGEAYPNLVSKADHVVEAINAEEKQFRKTIQSGLKQIKKLFSTNSSNQVNLSVTGQDLFDLYQTHGFPLELSLEEIEKTSIIGENQQIPVEYKQELTIAFNKAMKEHQSKSRAGAEQKFKGGLADHSEQVVKYHTATHLLLAGLQEELGDHVHQAGSNITAERLRFDFTHDNKIDTITLHKIEDFVNDAIRNGGEVTMETIPKIEAETDSTIEGSFWEKYPDMVNVYTMKLDDGTIISRELCGGPHVANLSEIKAKFKILKEESSSAGVRRIKATLETV